MLRHPIEYLYNILELVYQAIPHIKRKNHLFRTFRPYTSPYFPSPKSNQIQTQTPGYVNIVIYTRIQILHPPKARPPETSSMPNVLITRLDDWFNCSLTTALRVTARYSGMVHGFLGFKRLDSGQLKKGARGKEMIEEGNLAA